MTPSAVTPSRWAPRGLVAALIANFFWMNASEIFRYFVFVMPAMRTAFPQIPDIAPMSFSVFLVWGLWDTMLIVATTGFCWMFLTRFGRTWRLGLLAGSLVWLSVFVIFWLALFNMSLAPPKVLAMALPLSWVELAAAGLITTAAARRWPD